MRQAKRNENVTKTKLAYSILILFGIPVHVTLENATNFTRNFKSHCRKKYSKDMKKWEYSKRNKDDQTGILRETRTSTEQITKLVAEYFQTLVWGFTAEIGVSQC